PSRVRRSHRARAPCPRAGEAGDRADRGPGAHRARRGRPRGRAVPGLVPARAARGDGEHGGPAPDRGARRPDEHPPRGGLPGPGGDRRRRQERGRSAGSRWRAVAPGSTSDRGWAASIGAAAARGSARMDVQAFYAVIGGVSFTLLGLWQVVVTSRKDWRLSPQRRMLAYTVALHFLLPAMMSVLSMVAPGEPIIWRVVFSI